MSFQDILTNLHNIGLSNQEIEMFLITDEPKIPYFLCYPNEVAEKEYDTSNVFGQGFDIDIDLARVKAVSEFLERLCLENLPLKNLVKSKFEQKGNFVDPTIFCVYSDEQILNSERFKEECRKSEYLWHLSRDIVHDEERLIPAQLISLSSKLNDEFPIRGERISTGGAFGAKDINRVLESGFLEVIERDACISAYLMKKPLRKIMSLPPEIEEIGDYLERYNIEYHLFDATSDLNIPCVLAIAIDRTGIGAAVNVGSSSSFDYESAARKALLESIQCRRSDRFMSMKFQGRLPSKEEIFSLDDRFFYWHGLNRIDDLDFWLKTKEKVEFTNLNPKIKSFDHALELMKKRGFHVFVADMTLPRAAMEGFEALKVIIPEMHPMYLDERAKALYSVHYGPIKNNPKLKPHPFT